MAIIPRFPGKLQRRPSGFIDDFGRLAFYRAFAEHVKAGDDAVGITALQFMEPRQYIQYAPVIAAGKQAIFIAEADAQVLLMAEIVRLKDFVIEPRQIGAA
jgi:hypothetical protein